MFAPALPTGGLPGWVLLNRTFDRQTAAFDAAPRIQRDTEYFQANIADVRSAEDLVSDRRLLRVALGAFGLQDDLNNRAFIRAILEQGTVAQDALANRLTDDRYKRLADAFGFAEPDGPETTRPGFGAEITAQFRRREFEVAVGEQDQAMRLALNAQRELPLLAAEGGRDTTIWLRILGTPPLRQVFETALGLPEGVAQLDLDRQVEVFQDRARAALKLDSVSDLADPSRREEVIRRFLVQDQIRRVTVLTPAGVALSLLQARPAVR